MDYLLGFLFGVALQSAIFYLAGCITAMVLTLRHALIAVAISEVLGTLLLVCGVPAILCWLAALVALLTLLKRLTQEDLVPDILFMTLVASLITRVLWFILIGWI